GVEPPGETTSCGGSPDICSVGMLGVRNDVFCVDDTAPFEMLEAVRLNGCVVPGAGRLMPSGSNGSTQTLTRPTWPRPSVSDDKVGRMKKALEPLPTPMLNVSAAGPTLVIKAWYTNGTASELIDEVKNGSGEMATSTPGVGPGDTFGSAGPSGDPRNSRI